MIVEELLQPRYEIINNYPGNIHPIGTILYYDNNRVCFYGNTNSGAVRFYDDTDMGFEEFPHLFKPLAWYEKREVSEMPEYVKKGNVVIKISIGKDISESGSAWMVEKSPDGLRHRLQLNKCQPATQSEYEQYQK